MSLDPIMEETNPFVISKTEEDLAAEEELLPTEAEVVTVDRVDDVEDLIPLCVKHATGPQISASTFGYDIAQMERRPWDDPAAKRSDYFNYGFNETSWRLYCAMQAEGEESLLAKASEMLRKLKVADTAASPAGEERPAAAEAGGPYGASSAGHGPGFMGAGGYGGGGGGFDRRGAGGGPGGVNTARLFHKTKLCQRFAEGRCTRGADCNYAHGVEELRAAPPLPEGGSGGGSYGNDVLHHHGMHGGYAPPPNHQFSMGPYRPGANMQPMPMYDGRNTNSFRSGPKRHREEGGEY